MNVEKAHHYEMTAKCPIPSQEKIMAIEKLTGRAAIVTGGGSGIGGEIARTLAADEAQVLIIDIDEAAAAANVQQIEASGGQAVAMVIMNHKSAAN